MSVRDGYKKTEWGLVPLNWEIKKLNECVDVIDPQPDHRAPKEVKNGFPYVGVGDIDKCGNIVIEKCRKVSEAAVIKQEKSFTIDNDDIAFGKVGSLGNPKYLNYNFRYALSATLVLIKPKKVEVKYIYQCLQCEYFKMQVKINTTGSTRPTIGILKLRELKVILPPLKEQQKIAEILSTNDELISKTDEMIEKTKEIKKGLMQKLLSKGIGHSEFKDSELGLIPLEWEICQVKNGFSRIKKRNNGFNSNYLTISGKDGLVSQEKFFNKVVASKNTDNYFLLKKGDFAYNKSYSKGYPMGAIKRLDRYEFGILSPLYICFKLINDDFDSDYYMYYFESIYIVKSLAEIAQEGARNHGLLNVNIGEFFEIRVPLPPLEEQKQIASILTSIDNKIETLEKREEKLEEIKKGLMQDLLTGRVRVKID